MFNYQISYKSSPDPRTKDEFSESEINGFGERFAPKKSKFKTCIYFHNLCIIVQHYTTSVKSHSFLVIFN